MISVILPTAGQDQERARNLRETIHCLQQQSFSDWECILVEQSLDGHFYNGQLPCDQYFPVEDPGKRGFNLSWCRNIGARNAQGDRLLFIDADIVFPEDYLEKVAAVGSGPVFFGADRTVWSNRAQKTTYLRDRDLTKLLEELAYSASERHPTNIAIGFEKDWYWGTFGGYIENFFRWGGEVEESYARICSLLQKELLELPYLKEVHIGHLHHSNRDRVSETQNYELFQRYRQLAPVRIKESLQRAAVGNSRHPSLISLP